LYELISGQPAFTGENAASLIAAVMERQPAPLNIPPPLDRIIRICLAKDPGDRFQTAIDLKHALGWALDSTSAPSAKPVSRSKWLPAASLAAALV
jgi:serine/threonine protein kinase